MNISYSQNFEDILINRLFSKKDKGFYIDIGAAHPHTDSVTKFFYKRGWNGINIEPNEDYYNKLVKQRKNDINLNCAISSEQGEVSYVFVKEDPKISFIREYSSQDETTYENLTLIERKIQMTNLAQICDKHSISHVDFLKIDVEGAEKSVLEGIDFSKITPRLIVIESVEVKSNKKNSSKWLHLLHDQDYTEAYFDGSNSYFVKNSDQEAIDIYSLPLNSSDQFVAFKNTRFKNFIKNFMNH